MNKRRLLQISVVVWATLMTPHAVQATMITGGTSSTDADKGPAGGRDDSNVATSMTATYQAFCSWLLNGMQAQFAGVNVTFAGHGNIGDLFSPVPASDFKFTQYNAWVDTDPGAKEPTGFFDSRPVSNQDAGGVDAVLVYTPRPSTKDPTTVNFIQTFIANFNNTGFTTGGIDNLADSTPFYNNKGVHGTDSTQLFTRVTNEPGKGLNALGSTAWIADVPYVCESWVPTPLLFVPRGSNPDCTGGPPPPNDEILTSAVEAFQTFVESTQTIYYNNTLSTPYSLTNNGGVPQTWDVLYGGVQWGFSYTNSDPPNPQPVVPGPPSPAPEPSTIVLMGTALAAWFCHPRRPMAEMPSMLKSLAVWGDSNAHSQYQPDRRAGRLRRKSCEGGRVSECQRSGTRRTARAAATAS